jgi:putative transposase
VVTLSAQKDAAATLQTAYKVSERWACRVLSLPLSSKRYKAAPDKNVEVKARILYWAEKRPRYGSPRIHQMLVRRDGFKINHKRTERLYSDLKLSLRRSKRKKRYRSEVRVKPNRATSVSEVWAMDFVSDRLRDGRRVKGLTVVDTFSKENHVLEFDTSLTGERVVRLLDFATMMEGVPKAIQVDNGPEFICMALDKWAYSKGVSLYFSRPGKPTDNAYIESFNGKLRDEFLNMHWFASMLELKTKAQQWQAYYNEERMHGSLGWLTPMEFRKKGLTTALGQKIS